MSYTDSQIMAKLRKVRDKATDELVRIVCDGKIPVDKKGGWNGYSKCMHAMSGVGQEIVRQLQIEEIKRENAQVKNSTNIKIGWKEYSEDEENDSAPN